MKVLLVHAHPEPDSFVAAMRDTIANRFERHGAEIAHSDLYAMHFNPVISSADFGERANEGHLTYALEQRHGYETGTLSPDIQAEIAKVLETDIIVFTFPVFWFSVPAILKGWIDRVFISGPFYGGRRTYGKGGLVGKRALAVFSLGGREHMFGPDAIHGELANGMLRHFLQGALGYVGLDVLEPFIAYHVPYLTTEDREKILRDLEQSVDYIAIRPSLAMPDMDDYDKYLMRIVEER